MKRETNISNNNDDLNKYNKLKNNNIEIDFPLLSNNNSKIKKNKKTNDDFGIHTVESGAKYDDHTDSAMLDSSDSLIAMKKKKKRRMSDPLSVI